MSPEISAQWSKFRFGCGFGQSLVVLSGPDSCRKPVGPGLGTQAKTRQDDSSSMGTNGPGIGQSQRASLPTVRRPRVRKGADRVIKYLSFITVLHSLPEQRRAPASAVTSDRWTLALLAHGLEDLDVFIG